MSKFHKTRPDLNEQQIPSGHGHIAYELTRKKPPVFCEPELSDMKKWFEEFEKKYYSYFMVGNGKVPLTNLIKEFECIYETAEVVPEENVIKSDLELIQMFRTLSKLY